MIHLKEIEELLVIGNLAEARTALEHLLSLGPKNISALKLKGRLCAAEGRFHEENRVWESVIDADNADFDAMYFFHQRFLEEQECFYFSDPLPGGGRKFIAYPRRLIASSFVGLIGCCLFLLLNSFAQRYYLLSSPAVSFGAFGIFVLVPWLFILFNYFAALRDIVVTPDYIKVSTRIHSYTLYREDISAIYLANRIVDGQGCLTLILVAPSLENAIGIDLSRESTSVRARFSLLREVCILFGEPIYSAWDEVPTEGKKTLFF